MSLFSNWNGKVVKNDQICISPDNRSFKYGDGCFETIKIIDGKILLGDLHFQRLFSSLQTLKFAIPDFFTADYLSDQINTVVKINQHEKIARIRLVVYRGEGGLYDLENNNPNFVIQSWPGSTVSNYFNKTGLRIDIFNKAKKTADDFSSIKSNNYLGYAMGALFAQENGLDDCILTNALNRIADATIANVFIVNNGIIKTPPLTEGCVNGVMRRYLLSCLHKNSFPYQEVEIGREELMEASEIFLTNANYGIRWVSTMADKNYDKVLSSQLHKKFIEPLFSL